MCDYSITVEKTRPAVVGDKLTVERFGASKGFAPQGAGEPVAVCLRPGTEIAFDKPVGYADYGLAKPFVQTGHTTAIFRQVNKDQPLMHHDVLEFPDGSCAFLAHLHLAQRSTVLQLPAEPKNEAEEVAQRSVEAVG